MAKITIAQLQLQLEGLTARVVELETAAAVPSTVYQKRRTYAECKTPAEKAEYLRQFNRNKRKNSERQRINAKAPEGESPTVVERLRELAEDFDIPMTKLTVRSGCVWFNGEAIAEL